MQPGAPRLAGVGDLGERVERAAVHVPGLRADDRRPRVAGQSLAKRIGPHPALVVGLDDPHRAVAEAEQAQRPHDRHVPLRADDDEDGRRAGEAVRRPRPSRRQRARACAPRRAPVVLAPCAPVTKPNDTPSGRPRSSATRRPATASTAAAAGDRTTENAFWSHAEASQSAASAEGSELPITKP